MEKDDYLWVILAVVILMVIGLVIKPVLTHEEPNFQIPKLPELPSLQLPTPLPVMTTRPVTVATAKPVTTVPTPEVIPPWAITETPTPATTVSGWNGSTQTVGFVDLGTYNVNLTTFVPRHSEFIPQFSNQSGNQSPIRTVNYTSILSSPITGQWSGTTQVIDIPFPYWEVWYTVETTSSDLSKQAEGSGSYVIQPTQGEGVSMSGAAGSYSTAMPSFSIEVVDADDPTRYIETITPPGSLDPLLWKDNDPRPWKEKIFEGKNSYYLIIKARLLTSYSIDIKVPNSYLGKI